MHDEIIEVDLEAMRDYADLMEEQSKQIDKLCTGIESCMQIAMLAMDDLNGKIAGMQLQRQIEWLRSRMRTYDDIYVRLDEGRKLWLKLIGEGGQ